LEGNTHSGFQWKKLITSQLINDWFYVTPGGTGELYDIIIMFGGGKVDGRKGSTIQ
jgi:hypothetical protein